MSILTIPSAELRLRANYKFIRAKEQDIAEAVLRRDDRRLWTPKEAIQSLREHGEAVRIWLDILKEGMPAFAKVTEAHNLIPDLQLEALAALISGSDVDTTFKANYLALGNDTTAPAAGDLTLGNETIRGAFDDRSSDGKTAYLNKFFSAVDVGGNTYEEAGIFADATGTTDSGYLWSHVLLEVSLGAAETLTVNSSISLASA